MDINLRIKLANIGEFKLGFLKHEPNLGDLTDRAWIIEWAKKTLINSYKKGKKELVDEATYDEEIVEVVEEEPEMKSSERTDGINEAVGEIL